MNVVINVNKYSKEFSAWTQYCFAATLHSYESSRPLVVVL